MPLHWYCICRAARVFFMATEGREVRSVNQFAGHWPIGASDRLTYSVDPLPRSPLPKAPLGPQRTPKEDRPMKGGHQRNLACRMRLEDAS